MCRCDTSRTDIEFERNIMSTKAMRSGDTARAPGQQSTGKDSKPKVPKQLIERIKEATNATDEVIIHTLEECNYDPNEATTRLIESQDAMRQLLLLVSSALG